MADVVKARMTVSEMKMYPNGAGRHTEEVHLSAVYSDDPSNPNHGFSEATPYAELQITVSNPGAQGFFKPGMAFDITFEPADG